MPKDKLVPSDHLIGSNDSIGGSLQGVNVGSIQGHARPGRAKRHNRPGLNVRLRRAPGHTPRPVLRQQVRFPATIGSDFTVEEEFPWEEMSTVSAGDFLVPRAGEHAPSLRKWSTEALTMTWDPRWMQTRGISPKWFIKQMRKIGRARAPFHMLIVNKPNPHYVEYAGLAVLLRMSVVIKRGEPDTRYLAFDFSQYRPMELVRKRDPRLPTTRKLKEDDTLRSLSNHFYGNGKFWREIKKENGIGKVGSREPLIKMKRFKKGDRITIPEKPIVRIGGGSAHAHGNNKGNHLGMTERFNA